MSDNQGFSNFAKRSLLRTLKPWYYWYFFDAHPYVNSVAITPDGKRVISGGYNIDDYYPSLVMVWELETGKPLKTFTDHSSEVYSVAVTPDGQKVICHHRDNNAVAVKVWDLDTGKLLQTFTPDGKCLIYLDATIIKMRDLDTRKLLQTFTGDSSSVHSAVVTPDGKKIISCSQNLGLNTIKVWDLQRGCDVKVVEQVSLV